MLRKNSGTIQLCIVQSGHTASRQADEIQVAKFHTLKLTINLHMNSSELYGYSVKIFGGKIFLPVACQDKKLLPLIFYMNVSNHEYFPNYSIIITTTGAAK